MTQIVYNVVLLTFFIPYGISVAASVMIGNALGKGWSKSARKTTEVVYYLVVAVEIFAALFLILLRDYIPLIFTDEPEVIEYVTLLYNVREWLALFGNSKFVLFSQQNGCLYFPDCGWVSAV